MISELQATPLAEVLLDQGSSDWEHGEVRIRADDTFKDGKFFILTFNSSRFLEMGKGKDRLLEPLLIRVDRETGRREFMDIYQMLDCEKRGVFGS